MTSASMDRNQVGQLAPARKAPTVSRAPVLIVVEPEGSAPAAGGALSGACHWDLYRPVGPTGHARNVCRLVAAGGTTPVDVLSCVLPRLVGSMFRSLDDARAALACFIRANPDQCATTLLPSDAAVVGDSSCARRLPERGMARATGSRRTMSRGWVSTGTVEDAM